MARDERWRSSSCRPMTTSVWSTCSSSSSVGGRGREWRGEGADPVGSCRTDGRSKEAGVRKSQSAGCADETRRHKYKEQHLQKPCVLSLSLSLFLSARHRNRNDCITHWRNTISKNKSDDEKRPLPLRCSRPLATEPPAWSSCSTGCVSDCSFFAAGSSSASSSATSSVSESLPDAVNKPLQ